jgi:hypothetical protein
MRDYEDYGEYVDDSVRLHTPVLQRVIILAAVIIAVPVVMWTITAFVRSYVARPKAPALQHVATTETPAAARLSSPVAATAPPMANQAPANQPASPPREASPTAPPPAAVNNPPPPSVQPISSEAPPIPPPAPPSPRSANAGAEASATGSTPPSVGGRGAGAAPKGADNVAWPNPNSTSPPSFGSSAAPAAPAAPASTAPSALSRTAAIDTVPAAEPIRGPVPLPRQRPPALTMAAGEPTSRVSGGPVPLPRMRPSSAPADTSPPPVAPRGYNPGLGSGG